MGSAEDGQGPIKGHGDDASTSPKPDDGKQGSLGKDRTGQDGERPEVAVQPSSKKTRISETRAEPAGTRTDRYPSPPPRSPPRSRKRPGGTSRLAPSEKSAPAHEPQPTHREISQLPRGEPSGQISGTNSRSLIERNRDASTPSKFDYRREGRLDSERTDQDSVPEATDQPSSKRTRISETESKPAGTKRDRSLSPPPRSPPRPRKRPGVASRLAPSQKSGPVHEPQPPHREPLREPRGEPSGRFGVQNYVTQHYNSVLQRGRQWRATQSKIKGLRKFNNWIKACVITKFSGTLESNTLKVLDIGCGKGGDLGKWETAPKKVDLYVGLDPADISISQATERYEKMAQRRRARLFEGHFYVQDCFGESIERLPIIRSVGFDPRTTQRWNEGGFEIVSMMFCLHYAFESEAKARMMLRNVAGSLSKGGKFIGVLPNSDVLSERVRQSKEWGNEIYQVRFTGNVPKDGIFRPPFGWKYFFKLEEAVEEVPEYVVPWEAFRGLAEDYNLELEYRKTFREIWRDEKDDPVLGPLSQRYGVLKASNKSLDLNPAEMEAAYFYQAFCFYKV